MTSNVTPPPSDRLAVLRRKLLHLSAHSPSFRARYARLSAELARLTD